MKRTTRRQSPRKSKSASQRLRTPKRPRVEPVLVTPAPLFPFQHILVPIDFSIHSKNALRRALTLAEQFSAVLHLVYVVEPTIYPADLGFGQVVLPEVEDELRERGYAELKTLIEREVGGRVKTTLAVRTGKPHQEILLEADERHADLVVVATHGYTGVEQILFGSTAMRIVRLALCPVMVIRPRA